MAQKQASPLAIVIAVIVLLLVIWLIYKFTLAKPKPGPVEEMPGGLEPGVPHLPPGATPPLPPPPPAPPP